MSILEAGIKAPEIQAKDQQGKEVKLSDYKGKKVVLYFYPADDTPGCTAQACNLRDNISELNEKGYVVLGVSPDNEASHDKFSKKYDLPFELLADPDRKIIDAYGVWGEKNMYGKKFMGLKRTTFIIDEKGNIEKVIKGVRTKNHTEQILK